MLVHLDVGLGNPFPLRADCLFLCCCAVHTETPLVVSPAVQEYWCNVRCRCHFKHAVMSQAVHAAEV